jgi:cardiolipin synthase A/B
MLKAALLTAVLGIVGAIVVMNLLPEPRELNAPVPARLSAADPDFALTMGGLFGSGVTTGNTIDTLLNGDAIFPAMLDAIARAERSITFATYVYWSGSIADTFAEALAERARAGVTIKVLLDWQGSIPMEERLIDTMTAAGVEVVRFRPVRWYTLDRINNRTHRKVLVADGRVGFTGGVGIADEWLGDARDAGEWRDTHYRIEGPAVAALQSAFADNWIEATGEVLQGPAFFPPLEPVGATAAHVVRSSIGERNTMHLMLMTALSAADRSIRIGTPYFVPDEVAIGQLKEARRRGVEVDVLVPGKHINKDVVRYASRHLWGELLAAGVRIHEFQPTMYHVKLFVVDEVWAMVGSANFDERSFRLNDEASLGIFDARVARAQAATFDADLARARPITLQDWQNRTAAQKARDWLSSWFRKQL